MVRLISHALRSLTPLWLALALSVSGCANPSPPAAATEAGGPNAVAQEVPSGQRQGPFRVTCYKNEEVVFEHGTIYRVFRSEGEDAGWQYETGDGLKFRGRIGENVNCVWR